MITFKNIILGSIAIAFLLAIVFLKVVQSAYASI